MDSHSQDLDSNINTKRIKISLLNTYHKCTQILLQRWKASNPVNWKDDYFSKTLSLHIITGRFILDRPLQPSGKGKGEGIWPSGTRSPVPLCIPLAKKCTALPSVPTGPPKRKQMHWQGSANILSHTVRGNATSDYTRQATSTNISGITPPVMWQYDSLLH